MDPLADVKAKLEFSCAYENIPEPAAEADMLFKYARWLQKNNQLKRDGKVNIEIARLYRVAMEHDHFKANINLQNGAMRGQFEISRGEHLRLSQRLIDSKVATGYYFVGIFLEQGSAGLRKDQEMALRYYRKAADEGSALAQYYVAEKLAPIDIAPDVARQMRACAAQQGHGGAAVSLGVNLKNIGRYVESLEAFQLGVAAGDEISSSFLSKGFRGPEPEDALHYLGLKEDLGRAERYRIIGAVLGNYSYANPTVPEINEIVPLPPAKLPPWDGKLKWLEDRLANIPPEKPSEALIRKLAKEKVLDPATGKPMPGSPSFSDANFPVLICESDQPCPESGYWKVMITSLRETTRYFEQGEIMPRYTMSWKEPRIWPLRDKPMQCVKRVEWGLLG
ncbi:sel1 repeat family protein [Pseudomonas sp. 10-1B]|uniref:SEL1-like repeat protein n=1 Tax=Pseudomonas sp. 10-1B TaxID=1546029 RepID=UPI000AAEA65F|nr:SEL1-like repeat protein [Pseudomonas sp. 10-1B]